MSWTGIRWLVRNHKLLVAGFDPGCLAEEKGIRKVGAERETSTRIERKGGGARQSAVVRACVGVHQTPVALRFHSPSLDTRHSCFPPTPLAGGHFARRRRCGRAQHEAGMKPAASASARRRHADECAATDLASPPRPQNLSIFACPSFISPAARGWKSRGRRASHGGTWHGVLAYITEVRAFSSF